MQIKELMQTPPITCCETESINRAAQLMWEHDIGAVPVTDSDGRVIGMITDRDVAMAAYTTGSSLQSLPIGNSMSKVVYSCAPDETIVAVEKRMQEAQVHRVPVVDEDRRALGMVSVSDIARFADSNQKNGVNRELVHTLATISAPRTPIAEISSQQASA